MRIKAVKVAFVERSMPGNLRNARRRWTTKAMLFCFVEADDGRLGIGEGWTSYASPRALAATIEDDVAPLVVGRQLDEAFDIAGRCRDACVMSGRYGITAVALSAVEIALHDLRAKAAHEPLWRQLGGLEPRVPVYASAGLYRTDDAGPSLGNELRGYVDAGFRAVKIKVGGAPLAVDLDRIEEARDAIGPGIGLMVDAHYSFTFERAMAFAEAAAAYDLVWFEAPLAPTDYDGYAKLAAHSPIPLCGNETLPWREPFRHLADAGVRYLMPDVSACGGVGETLAIGAVAEAGGSAVTLHSSSSVVLFLASLHAAAAMPAAHSVEFHQMHRWYFDLVPPDTFALSDGCVVLGDQPGLGVELTPGSL